MSDITIKVVTSKKQLNRFIQFQYQLYKDSPYWVPPLRKQYAEIFNRDRNPFFQHGDMELFLCFKGNRGEIIGRVAAIKNDAHNRLYKDRVGFFGFFECINDREVGRKLLDSVGKWLRDQGFEIMRGPVNPTTNDECGFLVEGFDDFPRLLMPYTHNYYPNLMESCGLKKAKQLLAYKIETSKILALSKVKRVRDIAIKRNQLHIRPVNMKDFLREVKIITDIYNQAWSGNWGFFPISNSSAELMAVNLKRLVEPSLVLIAEVKEKPVGIIMVMYDYNAVLKKMRGRLFPFGFLHLINARKKISWLRLLLIGVLPGWQRKGIDAALYYEAARNARKLGVEFCEGSWVLEDNDAVNRLAPSLGADVYKRYNLYHENIS